MMRMKNGKEMTKVNGRKVFQRGLLLLVLLMFLLSGCSVMGTKIGTGEQGNSANAPQKNDQEGQEGGKRTVDTVQVGNDPTKPSEGAPADQGSFAIRLEAEFKEADGKMVIEGKTNLLPGTKLVGSIYVEDYIIMGYTDGAEVQHDGTFAITKIPKFDKDGIGKIILEQSNFQSEEIEKYYGKKGEKLEGPLIHQEETLVDGEKEMIKKAMLIKPYIFKEGEEIKGTFDQPAFDRPKDYGDPKVWITPTIEKDREFLYVSGKSNLLEGVNLNASINEGGRFIGYSSGTKINPDGSFYFIFDLPDTNKYKKLELHLSSQIYNEYDWKTIDEAYGEKGEKLKGDLVKKTGLGTEIRQITKLTGLYQ